MSKFTGVGSKTIIDGVGTLEVTFFPDEDVTYEDMLENKKYIAKKAIELLNGIYRQLEKDFDMYKSPYKISKTSDYDDIAKYKKDLRKRYYEGEFYPREAH